MASEVLARNADHSRWDFKADSRWQKAPAEWQEFYCHWSAVDKDEVLMKESMTLHPEGIELFVPGSYKTLFDCVSEVAYAPTCGVVITGQPGIGKTCFLWYSLVRLITLRQVILFANGNWLYLFFKEKVYIAQVSSFPLLPVFRDDPVGLSAFIWTLIDVDFRQTPPEEFLVRKPCFPVQASSPDPIRFKTWAKERAASKLVLPLWTRDELWKGLTLQREYDGFRTVMDSYLPPSPDRRPPPMPAHKYTHRVLCDLWKDGDKEKDTQSSNMEDDSLIEGEDADDDSIAKPASDCKDRNKLIDYAFWLLLNDAIEKFGCVARDVYHAILLNPHAILKDHQVAIASATYSSVSKLVDQFRRNQCFSDQGISHEIFAILPASFPPRDDDVTTFSLDFKSPWVAEQVMRQIEDDRLVEMYHFFKGQSPESAALARGCLQRLAFWLLTSGRTRNCFLKGMEGDLSQDAPIFKVAIDQSSDILDFPILPRRCVDFDDDDDLTTFRPGLLYIPRNSKNALFDALYIEYGKPNIYTLWVIHVTKSIDHAHGQGYVLVRKVINALKERGRGGEVNVSYVYAYESHNGAPEWKMPKGWTKNLERMNHQGKVFCWPVPIPSSSTWM